MVLSILALVFIVFELSKLIWSDKFWDMNIKFKKYRVLTIIETLYISFTICLLFTKFWYIGVAILLLSIITALKIAEPFLKNIGLNKETRGYLMVDGILTIILLLIIILTTFLWN